MTGSGAVSLAKARKDANPDPSRRTASIKTVLRLVLACLELDL